MRTGSSSEDSARKRKPGTWEKGVRVKCPSPWQRAAGRRNFSCRSGTCGYEPSGELARYGEVSRSGEGLICLFDEEGDPKALGGDEEVPPGSTVLFLGLIESG